MSQQIVAFFSTRAAWLEADAQLHAEGLSTRSPDIEGEVSDLSGKIRPHADTTVDQLEEEFALIVHAPFGRALRAQQVLRACGAKSVEEMAVTRPVRAAPETTNASMTPYAFPPDQSFFVSSVLGLPLLINCPTPLSSLLGLPALLRG